MMRKGNVRLNRLINLPNFIPNELLVNQEKVRRYTLAADSLPERDIREIQALRATDRCARLNLLILPDGPILFYWLSIIFIAVCYCWWFLIVRHAFPDLQILYVKLWLISDIIVDVIFFADILVQIRTGYLEQGLIVSNTQQLLLKYVKSPIFLLDVISLAPFDYFADLREIYPIIRATRLIKTHRAASFYYTLESRTAYPNGVRVAGLTHVLFLGCHWFACCQYMITRASRYGDRWSVNQAGISFDPFNGTLTQRYLISLYWSCLTLTTIGNNAIPETTPEYIFSIASYLIGVFVFATIVGQVGNVIANRNANRLEYEKLLDGAKQYMRDHRIPQDMQRRVRRWYEYSWSRGRIVGDSALSLTVLPDKLKTELALMVNLTALTKVTIFNRCQAEFLQDLVLKMKAIIFTPGDYICRKGEIAREMYIIADGVVEILSEDGEIIRVLKAGDFFGEIGILNMGAGMNRRTADVKSTGYSELFSLSKDDVLIAVKDYPQAEEIMRQHGQDRLNRSNSFNLRTPEEVKKKSLARTRETSLVTNLLGVSTAGRLSGDSCEFGCFDSMSLKCGSSPTGPNMAALPEFRFQLSEDNETRLLTDGIEAALVDFISPRLKPEFLNALNKVRSLYDKEFEQVTKQLRDREKKCEYLQKELINSKTNADKLKIKLREFEHTNQVRFELLDDQNDLDDRQISPLDPEPDCYL